MSVTAEELARAVAVEAGGRLAASSRTITHCVEQLSDRQVWWRAAESQNSIGNIILHLCGNLRQWIVAGIGGHPDVRDRSSEFSERRMIHKAELLDRLGNAVEEATGVLAGLTPRTLSSGDGSRGST